MKKEIERKIVGRIDILLLEDETFVIHNQIECDDKKELLHFIGNILDKTPHSI